MDHFDPPQPYLPDGDSGGTPTNWRHVVVGVAIVIFVLVGSTVAALYFFAP